MRFLWLDRNIRRNGCVNNIDVGNSRGLLDTGLLMLLQQEGINVGTDLCQAGIVGQIALRHRKPLQPLFKFSKSPIDVRLLGGEVHRSGFVGRPDLTLQFIDL